MKRILASSIAVSLGLLACNKGAAPVDPPAPGATPPSAPAASAPAEALSPEARIVHTRRLMLNITEAVTTYRNDNKQTCPPDLATLVAQHYLTHEAKDPWGNALVFICPADHYPFVGDLVSNGPDGKPETSDDIHSWDPSPR